METISPTITLDHIDMSSPHSQFLRLGDLDTAQSTSPEPSAFDEGGSTSQSSPPPVIVQSRQAKKRKSWGQELPEPKTALPPRKRAKTDDEKEQRRIERIKRNRAAAHNSRERKRAETEGLAVALARVTAELDAYRKLHGPLPSNIVLPEIHVQSDSPEADTPAPSLTHDAMSPPSPADSIFQYDSIKQEPQDHSFPITSLPPAFDNLDSKSSLLSPLDPTQHSAAMLCDLQCRSRRLSSSTTLNHLAWWTSHLANFQWQICCQAIMLTIWTLSPFRMARMMEASQLRFPSRSRTSSMTPLPLRSTPRRLALCNTATGLRAPQDGARALERRSFDASSRAGVKRVTQQSHANRINLALRKQVTEDQTMDDGDAKQGVQEFT
ncbi:uncharacterized protein RCC_02084 [Ramularia collo-cygni]|uniref:BZIP domain-containing protein n=1 Tax=Ramularia collo-cygni TaxID=112498 RepID=A0A2D3UM94_9PEZI|nr:uncharacterized protein RCC_02084 [Ramularia collo-cygni]CZT16242.1 uncharacterized protein RCC_02084 [Ramularia collo-cygni]